MRRRAKASRCAPWCSSRRAPDRVLLNGRLAPKPPTLSLPRMRGREGRGQLLAGLVRRAALSREVDAARRRDSPPGAYKRSFASPGELRLWESPQGDRVAVSQTVGAVHPAKL